MTTLQRHKIESLLERAELNKQFLFAKAIGVWFSPGEIRALLEESRFSLDPSRLSLRFPNERTIDLRRKLESAERDLKLWNQKVSGLINEK